MSGEARPAARRHSPRQRTAQRRAEAAAPQQAMIEITQNLHAFTARFNQAVAEVLTKALTAALKEKAAELRASARAQFATEGRSGGAPWAPHAYERRRPGTGRPRRPLLQRSGLLLTSLTEESNPAHVERLDVDERGIPYLVFGTVVTYSRFHQYGTRRIPQRQLLTPQMLGGTARAEFPL